MGKQSIYKNEYHELLEKIYAQCHRDPAFKERFLSDPKAVIEAEGLSVPPSVTIEAVEDTEPNILTLHLPPKPAEELSDQDLEMVSGGKSGSSSDSTGDAHKDTVDQRDPDEYIPPRHPGHNRPPGP